MKEKRLKWYSRMKPSELDAVAAQFDRAFDCSETRPLTPAMRKQEQRARRKKGGASAVSGSDLVAQGLRKLLEAA